ncbi:cadherin-like domain-containing protein [Shewanella alkalitolerans]|uniref:Ig-like domain-containing protein n=1 Tax=Shewanella alkalitolerans TaxID=2864209 RepID=UPI001C65DF3E|nr:NEW3 domain-containing protein [Shewanella alkalitolerans]QYJ99192.1 cadherin-like domain-containing protein [Shewanella alkalitolerans]
MSSVHCAAARTDSTFLKTFGLGLLGAGLLSASAIMPVHAGTHGEQTSAAAQAKREAKQQARLTHKAELETQTLQLSAVAAQFLNATKSNKGASHASDAALYQQLEALVAARQVEQQSLIALDPFSVVSSVLPMAKRRGIPAEIQAKLAQKAELVGEVEAVYEDFADPSENRLRHFMVTDQGRVEMHLPADTRSQKLQSGMQVKAKGWLFNTENTDNSSLAIEQGEENLLILAAGGETSSTSTSYYEAPTKSTGEQKVLVLMLNFQDNPVEPWTTGEAEQLIFGTVNDYYQEASNGKTWLTGNVEGYLTLPIETTCSSTDIDLAAREVAINQGIDISQYPRFVYIMPKNEICPNLLGRGTIGLGVNLSTPSKAWIFGEFDLNTIGHELGHNLGLQHAKYLGCSSEQIDSSCMSLEYGDNLDMMGKSEGHFNAFNKERLGWITADKGEVVTADRDGSYLLEPYETGSNGNAKSLKVRRGTDSVTGEPLYYYLEYRQPIGFDSFLSGKAVTQGVLVHLNRNEDNIDSSLLLDMTPGSSIYDLDDAALLPGKSYTDNLAGVTITTEWSDSSGVGVNVSYSEQQICTAAQPSIALASSSSVWGEAGETVSYRATLTNNDSAECGSSNYIVSAQVASGWNATQQSVSLTPGQSTTVSVNVTSSTTATDGFYDVTIEGVNASDSRYQASTTATYVVETPVAVCVLANPQWTLLSNSSTEVAAGTAVTYQGTLTNKDSDSCAASTFDVKTSLPSGWQATSASASLSPGQSQPLSITVTSATDANAGVYDFSMVALNRNNVGYQSSASATYQVAAPIASCQLAAPKLNVVDVLGADVEAGTVQYYGVEITNQNQDCDDATYHLSIATPSGWSASNNTVTLASGATTRVSVSVTSSTSANAGSYNLTLTVKDVANTAYSSTSTLVYRVAEQQNNAPVAYSDSVSMTSKAAIYINVLGNDKDIDGDTLAVTSATQGAKGSVQVLSDGRIKYTPAKSFKNGDSFSYTISDGELQSTATVSVTLASDSGNTGGGNKGKGKN